MRILLSYHLSALELHQELQEDGLVNERLRAHFSALASRLTAEPSTAVAGVVLNNYEELLKQKDERIALLEYELRVAREDVVSQQTELRRLQTLLTSACVYSDEHPVPRSVEAQTHHRRRGLGARRRKVRAIAPATPDAQQCRACISTEGGSCRALTRRARP